MCGPQWQALQHKKKTKKKPIKSTCHLIDMLLKFIFTLQKYGSISRMEFQLKLIENLISEHHISDERPSGRPPKTAPPTRMNEPHYLSYTAATVSKQNLCQHHVMCYKTSQCHETRYNCKSCRVTLGAVSCSQCYHMAADF
jgi:hypothetical protein